jgi:hypothetical protein
MILIAHIFGLPVEELATPLASGVAAGVLIELTALMARVRRRIR